MIKGSTNVGLFKTGENTVAIIDTGSEGNGEEIDKLLEEKGWTPEYIINTHTHIDHLGGNKYLMEKYNIPAYCGETEIAFVHYSELEAVCMNGGYPGNKLKKIFAHPGKIGFRPIEEAQLAGIEWTAIPGHSPAMIGVKTEDGVWFLGDAYLSRGFLSKHKFGFVYRIDDFMDSLEKIASLEGGLFVPAHGRIEEDVTETIQANIDNMNDLAEMIRDICTEFTGLDYIIKGMYERLELKPGTVQQVMLSSTTKAFLSYLQDRDKLECKFINNIMMW
ncbi:MAG: MBL fold metallo-hydrolase, partial [Eubacterium sp.]|nr:MBL fold metallo-hydrolase [Candidatus Colimonas fimequi]